MPPIQPRLPSPVQASPVRDAPPVVVAEAPAPKDSKPVDTFTPAPKVATATVSKDAAARAKSIDHMLRGNKPELSAAQRKNVDWAMRALSTAELAAFDKAGVRIWKGRDFPPELENAGLVPSDPLSSPAAYHPGAKVLQLNPDATVPGTDILHELGHTKDDLMDDPKGQKPILEYEGQKAREAALTKTMSFGSQGTKTFKTQTPNANGKLESASMTLKQMYEKYKGRTMLREDRFHSPTQANMYGMKNAQEFFGEAFAVFHGGDPAMKAKLLEGAPEIYFMLEADAKKNGIKPR